MRSKKSTSFLIGCLVVLSFLMIACDKRHKPDVTNLDRKADADETLSGTNIPATQGDAGDNLSNSNSTIDLNPTTGATTIDNEASVATQSPCSRSYSTKCTASDNVSTVVTPNPSPTVTPTVAGDIVELSDGLKFFKPINPALVRCGSLINRYIAGSHCSVNNYTGTSQPLGMVMKMKNGNVANEAACPKICMCTGENVELSGWNCQHLPAGKSYKIQIQGCGTRNKIFYQGTSKETTCSVNKGGDLVSFGTKKGMELVAGKQSVCDDADCVCKGKVTLNRKTAGWRCALGSETK